MALPPEKLRILTFPQRINGNQLELNVLILPTQQLLNQSVAFNSQLTDGGVVQLPAFLNADLQLEVKTIKGLSTYPFSDDTVLNAEGAVTNTFPTTLTYPVNMARVYEALYVQFKLETSSANPNQGAPPPLAASDGIRKYLKGDQGFLRWAEKEIFPILHSAHCMYGAYRYLLPSLARIFD